MPAITYSDFSGGLDRRLPINVQEANRLWVLRNASITVGKKIKKRPGLKVVSGALAGSVGLAAVNGRLKVFVAAGSTFTAPSAVDKVQLTNPALGAGQSLQRIYYASMFNGYMYVVADYDPAGVYVGGGRATIPQTPSPGSSA